MIKNKNKYPWLGDYREGEITKRQNKIFWTDGCAHYLDYTNGFTGIHTSKCIRSYTLSTCSLS